MEVVTKSATATQALGEKIGDNVIFLPQKSEAVVLALSGDLGSGKTTFVQGLAKGLGVAARIISPTFILMRKYEIGSRDQVVSSKGSAERNFLDTKNFYHIDLYRLEGDVVSELTNLGFSEIASDPSNIVVIEWAEKAKEVLPAHTYWLKFKSLEVDDRKILIPDSLFKR